MHVLILNSNGKFEEKDIDKGYKELQKIVGGLIDIPYLNTKLEDNGIDIIINDEGKMLKLPPSIALVRDKQVFSYLAGNVIFTGHDDEGNTISITNEQIELVKKLLLFRMFWNNITKEYINIRYYSY